LGLKISIFAGGGACLSLPQVSKCLNAGAMGRLDAESETLIPANRCDFDVSAYRTTGNDGCYETGDLVHALTTATDPNSHVLAFAQNQLGEVRIGDITNTLNTNSNASKRNAALAQQGMAVRRPTPRECERLQGFPDDYSLVPVRGKPAADGPRYKSLGNSMAVPVMRWIGQRIQRVDEIANQKEAA